MTKRTSVFVFFVLFLLCLPVLAGAADYLPKDESGGGNVTVAGDGEYKNLFVGGGTVAINKEILGDLFAGGGSVNISSPVDEDLFAVGGNVIISAAVGDDARLAGGNISVTAPIGGDLMIAGGTVNVSPGAIIGGDFWAAGGSINLNGNVDGNVKVAGGEISINSEIIGDVEIRANRKLVFGPQSKVLGKITYWGTDAAVVQGGAEVGQIDFHKTEKIVAKEKTSPGFMFGGFLLVKMLALLIAALVVLKLFGKSSRSLVDGLYAKPWANLGIGFLGMIAIPLAAIILLVTVFGYLVGLILIGWFALIMMFLSIFAAFFLGSLLERWIFKKTEVNLTWKTALWGVAVITLLSLIPVLGWLALCMVNLIVFGGFLREARVRLEI